MIKNDYQLLTHYYNCIFERTTNPTVVLVKICSRSGFPITSDEYKKFIERIGGTVPANLNEIKSIPISSYCIQLLGYEPPAEPCFKARIRNTDVMKEIELQEAIDFIEYLKEQYGI